MRGGVGTGVWPHPAVVKDCRNASGNREDCDYSGAGPQPSLSEIGRRPPVVSLRSHGVLAEKIDGLSADATAGGRDLIELSRRCRARTRRSSAVGIEIAREDMQEDVARAALHRHGARYMTATLMCAAGSQAPPHPVTFILAGHRCHGALRRAAAVRVTAAKRRAAARRNHGDGVLLELLVAVIDRAPTPVRAGATSTACRRRS